MKKMLFAAVLACLSLSVHASECGFFLFGGGGISSTFNIQSSKSISINGVDTPFDATLVSSNLTGGANGGIGYNFTRCLGLQGNFVYWGEQDYGVIYQFPGTSLNEHGRARSYSYGIEAIGHLPLCCDTINPFIKLGYARYHTHWKFGSNTGIPIDENGDFTNNGNGLIFGAGVAYAFNRCFDIALQAQWLYTDTQDVIQSNVTLGQYSINLVYHFGL